MKKLIIIHGDYGVFLFDEDTLVQYIHQNDALYSHEYHGPILHWACVVVEKRKEFTPEQKKIKDRYEK